MPVGQKTNIYDPATCREKTEGQLKSSSPYDGLEWDLNESTKDYARDKADQWSNCEAWVHDFLFAERSYPPMTGGCAVVGVAAVGFNGHSVRCLVRHVVLGFL